MSLIFGREASRLYDNKESGKRTLTLALAEGIAKVYGLSYCKMITPNSSIPKIEDLPSKAKSLALKRQSEGKKMRNDELELPKHIMKVLKSGKLLEEFTSSDILRLLPKNIKGQIKSTRITDLFKKGELRDRVEETGRKRGREKVYRLK